MNARILIVEDESLAAMSLSNKLTKMGMTVLGVCASGSDVIAMIKKLNPSLILMDIKLKGQMDGIEVSNQIRQHFDLPIIYVTAHADYETFIKAAHTGPSGYITKPIHEGELKRSIELSQIKVDLESKLKKSERRFRGIFEFSPTGIAIFGRDMKFLSSNQALTEFLGFSENEFKTMEFTHLVHPDYKHESQEKINDLAEGRISHFSLTTKLIKKNSKSVWGQIGFKKFEIEQEKMPHFLGMIEDIDVQKITELELAHAKKKAENTSRMKSEYLANMSHEIRTPLTAIAGFSKLMLEKQLSEDDGNNAIETIHKNSIHLEKLLSNILDISKIEMGKIELRHQRCSVSEHISIVKGLLLPKANEKQIELKINISIDVPQKITTDPLRFRQILINVIGNAIKYTSKGSVEVFIEPENANKQRLKITVTDTGTGLSKEEGLHIFDPFNRAHVDKEIKFGGTGLGLSISRNLSRMLGGDIVLEKSQVGKGSTFKIYVRIDEVAKIEGNRILSSQEPVTKTEIRNKKILVVEDSKDIQILMKTILSYRGANVELASNGLEAVQQPNINSFDVILMDIQMPVLDGYSATKQLRAAGCKIPIIALTARVAIEEKEKSMSCGCTDIVEKPVNHKKLFELIAYHSN